MKTRIITAILLIVCGAGIGWLAYENLMWAVWGKQNSWFEVIGFWGCMVMIAAGFIAIKSLWFGSLIGLIGFVLSLLYLGPVLVNTAYAIANGRVVLTPLAAVVLILIVVVPLATLARVALNVRRSS